MKKFLSIIAMLTVLAFGTLASAAQVTSTPNPLAIPASYTIAETLTASVTGGPLVITNPNGWSNAAHVTTTYVVNPAAHSQGVWHAFYLLSATPFGANVVGNPSGYNASSNIAIQVNGTGGVTGCGAAGTGVLSSLTNVCSQSNPVTAAALSGGTGSGNFGTDVTVGFLNGNIAPTIPGTYNLTLNYTAIIP